MDTSRKAALHGFLGIAKPAAALGHIARPYRCLNLKWRHHRNESDEAEASINEAYSNRAPSPRAEKREEADLSNRSDNQPPQNSHHCSGDEKLVISSSTSPTLLSSTSNRVTPPTGTTPRKLTVSNAQMTTPRQVLHSHARSSSWAETPTTPTRPDDPPAPAPPLSRITSGRRTPTPIIFSHSTAARRQAKPIEKKLECTLEELCHGSLKKVKITREVISKDGLIVQEEDILKIKIRPGWKKGTKITFEGKGDEKPGMHPADIIFIIDQKTHPLFTRQGDHLEVEVQIPLVEALTGCTVSIPLLGGDKMTLSVDDIIFPGFEKRIPGQGMPLYKEEDKRGDLLVKFFVEFPTDLSEEQRSAIVNVLDECS